MLLNADSYEFFLKQTREAEKKFFRYSAQCIIEISKISDHNEEMLNPLSEESISDNLPNLDLSDLNLPRKNIKKFKDARIAGEQVLSISNKFITEMEMMKDLSENIFDSDLDISETERFELFENYSESIDKSILMQRKVIEMIVMEMETLKQFEADEGGEHNDEDDGVNYE